MLRRAPLLSCIAVLAIALLGCPPDGEPGDPCTASGSGFTRKDSCQTMCLDWGIRCPNGATVTPNICAGSTCSGPGAACPSGMACMAVDSVSYRCVHLTACASSSELDRDPGRFGLQTGPMLHAKPAAPLTRPAGTVNGGR